MAADLLALALELTAAVTIGLLAVLLLRRPVRALFGARASYGLWLLVPVMALAVMLPGPVEAPSSPIAVSTQAALAPVGVETAAPTSINVARLIPQRPAQLPNLKDLAPALITVWLLGALACAAVIARRQRRFLADLGPLRAELRPDGRVFHAARPDVGPVLVGALSPRVILPGDFADRFSPEEQAVVVAHERAHLTGGDAQINLATAVAQAVFWFHPLVHLAARLIRVDQELACDETVVARFPSARRLYAEAMLKVQLAPTAAPLGCHWPAGGVSALKHRIARLNLRLSPVRRASGLVLAAALAAAGGATAWAAQPARMTEVADEHPTSPSTRALVEAIQSGRTAYAARLIRDGANVNANVFGEGTPLILAARERQMELVRMLLQQGADSNKAVLGDGSALIVAADNGDLPMVELLLARRADPDLAVHGDGSPLIAAAANGHLPVVERLLAAGATVDLIVPSDETALINAAGQGHLAVVQRLVEAGADVNLAVMAPRSGLPPERRSPLSMARRSGAADVIAWLRAHGARA